MPQFDDRLINTRVESLHHKEQENLISIMAAKYGLQYANLQGIPIDVEALSLIPESESRAAEMAVFARQNKQLSVAMQNPGNPRTTEMLERLRTSGYEVQGYLVSSLSLDHAWIRYQDVKPAVAERKGVLDVDPESIAEFAKDIASHLDAAERIAQIQASDNPEKISHIIEVLFGGALALGASDIHIEPEPSDIRVRYRLDGVLWDVTSIDKSVHRLLVSRLKLLSGAKLNVRSEAQEGRFTFDIGDRSLEVRSSIIPGAHGESIVMRLLDPNAPSFTLEHLGLNEKLHAVMLEELARPNGAIVTTGPTGSGKTTALYAFLQQVHSAGVKIITIEDPVEYHLPGITQTQVDDGYTFESGLKAILRQDPDIIMIGEIRDRDVASTATNAALTGHLVFSTLHTNSAAGAIPRLLDLGVDARMIGSAYNIMLGQRLVRILCQHCKTPREATTEEQKTLTRIMNEPIAQHTIYDAKGCEQCGMSGYKGRIGIFEAIRIDASVEEALLRDPRESNILAAAKPQNIPTMQQDGILKVLSGSTSLDELERVIDLHNTRIGDNSDTPAIPS